MFWSRKDRVLPLPEGPYVPGAFDLMTEYSPDGCFIRVFYPTSFTNLEHLKSRWISWLPHDNFLNAFAYVLKIWTFVLRFIFKLLAGDAKIPVAWEADLHKEGDRFPVIVFSHGLGASRFFYSTICLEMASRGFVVAAVEHRDKSACSTFYYASPEERKSNKPTRVKFQRIPLGKNHLASRQKQVRHRAGECENTIDLLEKLNAGKQIENIMGGYFDLSQFKDRLDMSQLVMMGHSFGGGTALRALGNDSRFKVGVVLDAWVFSIKDDEDLLTKVTQPLIFINTQTFQIAPNVAVMQKFMEGGPAEKTERLAFTIRRSTHEQQSDTPFLVGSWQNLLMKKIDSATAMKINNHLILRFLQKHIGLPSGKMSEEFLHQRDEDIARSLSV